jgi:acyl carrier protein
MAEILTLQERPPAADHVVAEIVRLLEPHRKTDAPIGPETDIATELSLDSLAVMNMLMDVEERFDVSIPLNVVPEIRTVGDLALAIKDAKKD